MGRLRPGDAVAQPVLVRDISKTMKNLSRPRVFQGNPEVAVKGAALNTPQLAVDKGLGPLGLQKCGRLERGLERLPFTEDSGKRLGGGGAAPRDAPIRIDEDCRQLAAGAKLLESLRIHFPPARVHGHPNLILKRTELPGRRGPLLYSQIALLKNLGQRS